MMSLGFYVLGICSVYGHFLGVSWGVQVHFSHFIDHGRPAEHNWTLSSPFRTQLVCVWITEDIELSWLVGQSARTYQGFLQSPHPRGHFVVIWHLLHLFDTFSTEGPISHTLSTPVVQVGSVARGGDEVWSCLAWVVFFLSVFFF